MPLVWQDSRNPTQILIAISSLASPAVEHLRIAVAYATLGGCAALLPRLQDRIGAARYRHIAKAIVVSFDFCITDPRALDYLVGDGFEVRVSNHRRGCFHPKLYVLGRNDGNGLFVGSANLTQGAVTINSEAGWHQQNADDAGAWGLAYEHSDELTDARLVAYRALRRRHPPTTRDIIVRPLPLPQGRTLPAFDQALQDGQIDFQQYSNFWVEAGSMSSGGSHNQLELPRGANQFFGFAFRDYSDRHAVIGHPVLVSRGRRWDDKPLTWHGHNRMERINLPTVAQGGFAYPQTGILFKRVLEGFELHVVPWDDPVAVAWRNASVQSAALHRVGGGATPRICGLF